MSEENLWFIKRVHDDTVLCTTSKEWGERPENTEWFEERDVPDSHTYLGIRQDILEMMGYFTLSEKSAYLPEIVKDCTGESYEEHELKFVKFEDKPEVH